MLARLTRSLLAVPLLGAALVAQTAGDTELVVHHSFPEAGGVLRIVVEGFSGAGALVSLEDPAAAPPSVREHLLAGGNQLASPPNSLTVLWPVDDRGLVRFVTDLDDPDDADRFAGHNAEHAIAEVVETVAVQRTRQSACIFEHADTTTDFGTRLRDRFAVFKSFPIGDFLRPRSDALGSFQKHSRPVCT